MTRTRELTFFFFFFFTWLFSSVSSHLCYLSFMSTSERQYTKYDLDRNSERETAHTPEPDSHAGLLLTALLFLFFLSLIFYFFGCFSNMQNQANCLSVNIICDFSCTYTFYVLSDWVNRDSKQKPAVAWFPQEKKEREREREEWTRPLFNASYWANITPSQAYFPSPWCAQASSRHHEHKLMTQRSVKSSISPE